MSFFSERLFKKLLDIYAPWIITIFKEINSVKYFYQSNNESWENCEEVIITLDYLDLLETLCRFVYFADSKELSADKSLFEWTLLPMFVRG